ncbi:DedA family protein [[Kitasatospora] papulosa]|uniref:DedA family protein n=1 Tax=[Kitasatospora] papulosa TaxID=1464011 RepID=UPI002E1098BF|nr:DedA family protein [[Kitasatospora] papulosa]
MNTVSQLLDHLPHGLAYVVVAGAILAESLLLIGAFIPTLTLLLTVGALARSGEISLPLIITTVAAAVVAGDLLAHRTGQLLGTRLRTGRIGRRIPPVAWRQAERLMNRHGGRAIFITRFLPVVRTLAPHFAGATRLPYRRIAPYSVTAACLWATAEISAGYAAAASLERILTLGAPALAAIAVTVLTTVTLWRRHSAPRRQHDHEAQPAPATPEAHHHQHEPLSLVGEQR